MNCSICNKEITSAITGDKCTSCYFRKPEPMEKAWVHEPTGEAQKELVELIQKMEENKSVESSIPEEPEVIQEKEKPPIISKENQAPENGKKYCQSCIERGFGLVPATREWRDDYFICDDCFEPLINNILSPADEDLRKIKENPTIDENKPILNQFYDLLGIPEALRFQLADKVLSARNDIFNYHAPAIVNKDVKEVASEIEQLQIMLFQIKIAIEPRQDYINRVKHSEREKANLTSIEKGKKEFSKGPSRVKLGQDQKMADTLFKHEPSAEKRLKLYLDLQKQAREQEFKNRTGT